MIRWTNESSAVARCAEGPACAAAKAPPGAILLPSLAALSCKVTLFDRDGNMAGLSR
jgi:hypothetical protein